MRCKACGARYRRWRRRFIDTHLGAVEVRSPLLRRGLCQSCFEAINEQLDAEIDLICKEVEDIG